MSSIQPIKVVWADVTFDVDGAPARHGWTGTFHPDAPPEVEQVLRQNGARWCLLQAPNGVDVTIKISTVDDFYELDDEETDQ